MSSFAQEQLTPHDHHPAARAPFCCTAPLPDHFPLLPASAHPFSPDRHRARRPDSFWEFSHADGAHPCTAAASTSTVNMCAQSAVQIPSRRAILKTASAASAVLVLVALRLTNREVLYRDED